MEHVYIVEFLTQHHIVVGSLNHLLTMTDACNFLSSVYRGERRDLAASALFAIPLLREVLLF
jgi:hypothetical protein